MKIKIKESKIITAGPIIGLATSTGVGGVVSSATTTTAAAAAVDSVRFIRRDRGADKAEDVVYETTVTSFTGEDLLQAAAEAAKLERSSIFKFKDPTIRDRIKNGTMVIRYEYRHKNPASDAFKKLSLASILEERMVVINKKKQYELLCP